VFSSHRLAGRSRLAHVPQSGGRLGVATEVDDNVDELLDELAELAAELGPTSGEYAKALRRSPPDPEVLQSIVDGFRAQVAAYAGEPSI
jgi:hypothetical protein